MRRFEVLEVSLETIRCLREPLVVIRRNDPKLWQQIRGAASSVPMNIAEGRRRCGKDRLHHWRIAAGSADELQTALRVAEAWGDVEAESLVPALERVDRVLAMLWRMTN